MIALSFAEPFLLLGLLAVAIPLLLHLLARSRAQEVFFPTLRFLRISMEKTARRRRIQHLLLMLLRMLLMGLLALAVAEPISQALGGWMSGRSFACILLVDNSMSMSARAGAPAAGPAAPAGAAPQGLAPSGLSRLDKARSESKAFLSGDDRRSLSLAALWTTNGPAGESDLTGSLDGLRQRADRIEPSFGKAPLAQRVAAAVAALEKQSVPQKAVALFSDLQKVSFEELLAADDLAKAQDVHLLVINAADATASNVAVTDVKVEGRPIVDQLQTVTATLENSSPTERIVHAGLFVHGEAVGPKVRLALAAAGAEGCIATAKLNWWPREAGTLVGEVRIDESDDLPQDNVRRFAVQIGGRIKALIVRGPASDPRQPVSDPAWMLNLALNPFADKPGGWLIETQTIAAADFSPANLQGAATGPTARPEIVFLCDVPTFSAEHASALEEMAAGGGTVVLFLGPNVDVRNYNDVLGRPAGAEGGLLPAAISPAVGDVGPTAPALFLKWVDLEHPFFKGLYKDLSDVKEDIRGYVQRYYPLSKIEPPAAELVTLESNHPLIVSKPFGQGRVVLCATSAAPGWSNLPATSLFPPMVIRMSMLARRHLGPYGGAPAGESFLPGAQVTIRPRAQGEAGEVVIAITPPSTGLPAGEPAQARLGSPVATEDGKVATVTVKAARTAEGLAAQFSQTAAAGVYEWKVVSPAGSEAPGGAGPGQGEHGAFVVNPPAEESRLESISPEALRQGLEAKGCKHVYIGQTFAEARSAALAAAQKRNWWDVLAAAAIVALVVESLLANRWRKPMDSAVPAHLNPRLSPSAGA